MRARPALRPLVLAAALLGGAVSAAHASAGSFDSLAGFSTQQGQDGWTYGYYTQPGIADSFQLLTYGLNPERPTFWANATTNPPWTLLWADGGHPNGTNGARVEDAVRRWTSDTAGLLTLTGDYQMQNAGSTLLSVLVDGVSVWSALATTDRQTLSLSTLVKLGSHVDFVINSNGVDYNDSTRFTVAGSVSAVPEPQALALMVAGLLAVGGAARARRQR